MRVKCFQTQLGCSWDVVLSEADLFHLLFVLTQGTLIFHLAVELAD